MSSNCCNKVDCLSSNGFSDNYDFLRTKQTEFAADQKPLVPPPLVKGGDVMDLGVPAGPRVGELLQAVQDLQLEGTLTTATAPAVALRASRPSPTDRHRTLGHMSEGAMRALRWLAELHTWNS